MDIQQIEWKGCKSLWGGVYEKNSYLSPYMRADFVDLSLKYNFFGRNRWNRRPIFYVCTTESNKKIIVPLLIGKHDAHLIGDSSAAGYTEFIYPMDTTFEDFDEVFAMLGRKLSGKQLQLNKINQNSLMYPYMREHFEEYKERVCVNISLPESIDEYLGRLSKSVKQNYRTSKNRMAKEGKSWRVEFYSNEVLNSELNRQLIDLYITRSQDRDGKKINFVEKLYQKHFNIISIATSSLPGNFVACLYIDDNVAGYLSGFISNDYRSIIVPRLATNTVSYGVYATGTLLIYETVKYLIENTTIRNLDLSRGSEKYKYVMGGETHYNYEYRIQYLQQYTT